METDVIIYLGSLAVSAIGGFAAAVYSRKPAVQKALESGSLSETRVAALRDQIGLADVTGAFPPALAQELYAFLAEVDAARRGVIDPPPPLT